MKIIHIAIGLFYLIYSLINITHLGIGEYLPLSFALFSIYFFRKVLKKDITGMYLAGMMTGLMVEYITEAYWKYSLNVFLWKDVSLYVVLGWGFTFTFFIMLSEKSFNLLVIGFNKTFPRQVPKQVNGNEYPGIILFDAFLAVPWFVGYELIGMKVLKLWEYRDMAEWNTILPIINYPLEGIIGAFLFGMILPSFIRYWGPHLRFSN